MPANIGMRARTLAPSDQRWERPAPSVPNITAILVSDAVVAANVLSSSASGAGLSATVMKPAAANCSGASRQVSNRAHGSEKTAPMLTLIDRRYNGSAVRGD